jgi:hypothetical protein
MVALEEYDTISKEYIQRRKTVGSIIQSYSKVADEFDSFRTSQTEFNTDVTTTDGPPP